ncbi:iron-sulfur cluster assembly protein NAR1 Ecym_6488 [Eremothecium cymbalariae DBVPG|uniref:Cytosolic Fe-S cluster assembly factor NAR1 n=1 Tax=Eremothecium cymbalariae (strain CBS 270.75 / DBVPG 7215 / KCTC 17166 / NRRL Y-17582) TaxID=931890 RepID=G8JUS6_ERECY|nr:hypothetical protein Ecym_6488 [Eremothecium cymbalariae DBVPG\
MSALLSESDLNDFISPGLACIKPAEARHGESQDDYGKLEVGKESSEVSKVSISLQDCLACAGCITSSEEILLGRQSHGVFLEEWGKLPSSRPLVVSISPQCRLSLADYFHMEQGELDQCLIGMFHSYFNARYVVGTQMGRMVTIQQTNKYLSKRRLHGNEGPMLCSVCPGFVLYAEKTKPDLVPFLLDVKSPQQITGALLLETVSDMYHLAIMPCFDKKLEASRKDSEREVDCVITPRELVTMLTELSVDISHYKSHDSSLIHRLSPPGWDPAVHWSSSRGSSSGGYAYQYLLSVQQAHPESSIVTLHGKISDVVEHRLLDQVGNIIASSTEVYGFRNIQNMVRRLLVKSSNRNVNILRKRHASRPKTPTQTNAANHQNVTQDPYKTDFIEVMACPGGCINGGGLLNGEQSSAQRKQLTAQLNNNYRQLPLVDISSETIPTTKEYVYDLKPVINSTDIVTVSNTW